MNRWEGIDNPRLRGRKRPGVHVSSSSRIEGIDNPRLRGRKQKLMILSFHANIQNTDAQADQQWLEPQETTQIR